MNVIIYPTAGDFLIAAGDLLKSDEARYSLIYGIACVVSINPHHYSERDPWFCTVSNNEGINALAWRTPPYPLGLAWHAGDPEEVVPLLTEIVHNKWGEISGVIGHREVTAPFVEKWCKTYGTLIQSTQAQRIYRLDSVNDVPAVSGRIRLATLADKDLVSGWRRAFGVESGMPASESTPERDITPFIEQGIVYLWEDSGKPVSMAMKIRPTDHSIAVSYVYTPQGLRRNGYAMACVASVCREILKSGYDFCTLYTDLNNPTSNSIYMKIGFKPVCDSIMYEFSSPIP